MKNLLSRYTQYNYWANGRMIEFLQSLPQEELDAEIVSSFTSIKKTLYHIWDAESLWLSRLGGVSPATFPSRRYTGTFDEAVSALKKCDQELMDYAETIYEDRLTTLLTYKTVKGDEFQNLIADVLMHVVNHGTYHRGQIITMLRQSSHTTLFSTDYVSYCRETVSP